MSVTALLVLLVSGSQPPSSVQVDPAVTEVPHCRTSALAFRTATEGWMFDHCGGVFRSFDGGRSWKESPELEAAQFFGAVDRGASSMALHPYVQHTVWLSETVGLAFAYGKPTVLRTEDAGRTWKPSPLPSPDSEMVYGVDHVGERVWFCGSTGRVSRSTDQGRTWVAGQQLFDKAGINPTNWCAGLSFLDAQNGWAAGWRSLWRTRDGGITWSAMTAVPVAKDEEVRGLVRLTDSLAWARTGTDALYRTRDGGDRWEVVPTTRPRPQVLVRPDGRAMVVQARPEGHAR